MGKFNPKVLSDLTQRIKDQKGGSGVVLDARKMETDTPTTVRLLKPKGNQGGEWLYAAQGILFWINKKPYLSPASLGKPCPIREEIEKAKLLKSKNIDNLLNNWKTFSEDLSFYMPIAHVDCDIDEDSGDIKKVVYAGPERVLKVPISLMDGIHSIVVSKDVQYGSEGEGIFHQKLGYGINLEKTGVKKNTRYTATLSPVRIPIDDKHYEPYDIMEMFKKQIKPDDVLRKAIRDYLFGEDDETGLEPEADNPDDLDEKYDKKVDFSDPEETLEMSLEEDFDLSDL